MVVQWIFCDCACYCFFSTSKPINTTSNQNKKKIPWVLNYMKSKKKARKIFPTHTNLYTWRNLHQKSKKNPIMPIFLLFINLVFLIFSLIYTILIIIIIIIELRLHRHTHRRHSPLLTHCHRVNLRHRRRRPHLRSQSLRHRPLPPPLLLLRLVTVASS